MRKSPVFIVFAGAPVAAKNRENHQREMQAEATKKS